jgi:glyoxylase-like metal-dependent hydrolase (beta-lactamase superfamily II)
VFVSMIRTISLLFLLSMFSYKLWAVENLSQIMQQYPPAPITMTLQQVSEHVYYVEGAAGTALDNEGFISNAGFVVTPAGVVVFDALGTPSLAAMLLKQIRSVTDQPIVKVISSHYHADHIYGLQVFKELGAEIVAPAGANDYLNAPTAEERLEERRFSLDPWVNDKTYLVPPDVLLTESMQFELGGVIFVITLVGGAHSDGDLTLYIEPDRVLFSGDIIFEGRVAFLGDANTRHWLDVLTQMETSKLVALIPGHGPAAKDPNQAISMTRHYLAYIREAMGKAVEEMTSFDEVYAATDWSDFKDLPAFEAANRRNAYQVYLSMEEELLAP